jgi:hypothetical protein
MNENLSYIDSSEITKTEKIGSGTSGEVWLGTCRGAVQSDNFARK